MYLDGAILVGIARLKFLVDTSKRQIHIIYLYIINIFFAYGTISKQ